MPQLSSISDFKAYKFLDMKIYSSTEWLAGNRKKYRQVFEQSDIQYIYADLSLANKLFDRENWDVEVTLICYLLNKGKTEMCTLKINKLVNKTDHIINIREGWGHKRAGSFWKKGKYIWEAMIGSEKVASKSFYIEDLIPLVSSPIETILKVKSIDYYEGNFDQGEETEDKNYYVQFDSNETRYVFVELTLENRLKSKDWHAELFIKFYNDSRDLKGEVVRLEKVKRGDSTIVVSAGWGSNIKGSWRNGEYEVEVIFQNKLISKSRFTVGPNFIEGFNPVQYPEGIINHENETEKLKKNTKAALAQLNSLIGLKDVKKQIYDHTKYIKFLQLRKERGFEEDRLIQLHSVFKGNPGTGKTTVARMLGAIYHNIGLLDKGHVHEVSRLDLVGEYIGQTAPKVIDAINKARGGVLFIDEAYSLARSNEDSKDFGREVIELLIKEMSHPKCDFMVIVAGYPDEMNTFVSSNPGLASRFKYNYDFPDFEYEDLIRILDYFCVKMQVDLSLGARVYIESVIQEDHRNKEKNFGNARYINGLLEKAKINMGIRLMNEPKKEWSDQDLRLILIKDVNVLSAKNNKKRNIIIDENELSAALSQLDELIGLKAIKTKIHELVNVVKHRILQGQLISGSINMHTVLIGNPGTGKTTVTRICARIFKALGVLSKGHIVETDRQGLVAGFVGQTAIKTSKVIKDAMGGLLFIDEAYGLHKKGSYNDFGDEAIQVLLKQMEDKRGDFFVFAAGYPKEMDEFLKMNPGLKSRFDFYLHFEDFSVEELVQISDFLLSEKGYKMSSEGKELLINKLSEEFNNKDQMFGNARRVRVYVNEIIRQQNLRLADEGQNASSHYNTLLKRIDVLQGIAGIESEFNYDRKKISF